LAANTGQPYERIYADADRDHWFTAIEAKEYGLVDDVIYKKK
jgi:ATP-dependent Clp protease protease subunit